MGYFYGQGTSGAASLAAPPGGGGGDQPINCYNDDMCPTGYRCVNGECEPTGGGGETGGGGPPREGCRKVMPSQECFPGSGEERIVNAAGEWCCPPDDSGGGGGTGGGGGGGTESCPEGIGEAYEGCGCGKYYPTKTGKCVPGYVFIGRTGSGWEGYAEGAIGRCECSKWCEDTGYGADCQGGGQQGLGEYQYPAGLQELMDLLLGRAKDVLSRPEGFSQDALTSMFGKGFEGLRSGQAATREMTMEDLARQGMLGTGVGSKRLADQSWATEGMVGDIRRNIFLENEQQKRKDLELYTGLASSIFGGGMNYEQLREAINSGRRGEGQSALMMLLSLLNLYK